jgi:hypothetical protein
MRDYAWHLALPDELRGKKWRADQKHRYLRGGQGHFDCRLPLRPSRNSRIGPNINETATRQHRNVQREFVQPPSIVMAVAYEDVRS